MSSKTYGLKLQSRVLRQYPGTNGSYWIAATNSLREENEVRVIQYDEKSEVLSSPFAYVHHSEVWDLALSPDDPNSFVTIHSDGTKREVDIWKGKEGDGKLEKISNIEVDGKKILWRGYHALSLAGLCSSRPDDILTLEDTKISIWKIHEGRAIEEASGKGAELDQFSNLHLSRNNPHVLYIANGQGYELWDTRGMKKEQTVDHCHDMALRSIDTTKNSVATCGDDSIVKIWDDRKPNEHVLELTGHSHWVFDCHFNQRYPSLLLSASSDATVILWNLAKAQTESQSPQSVIGDGMGYEKASTYSDHDESIYAVEWSMSDEWTFASLSYDGRIVVSKVPSETKYELLI